jgi:hypothetical protein
MEINPHSNHAFERAQMEKTADWHMFDPQMTLTKLLIQELLHEPDGRFPMTLTCDSLGGQDMLLELVRSEDKILAIYYLSDIGARIWAEKFGFIFVDMGWKVIERNRLPYIVGFSSPRRDPGRLAAAVESTFDLLTPEVVKTGDLADTTYSCPAI